MTLTTEALPSMPPEPEFRDGEWWYRGGKYYKTEAFREYHDDRSEALRARLTLLMEYARHGEVCTYIAPEYGYGPCGCGLAALLEKLREEL